MVPRYLGTLLNVQEHPPLPIDSARVESDEHQIDCTYIFSSSLAYNFVSLFSFDIPRDIDGC